MTDITDQMNLLVKPAVTRQTGLERHVREFLGSNSQRVQRSLVINDLSTLCGVAAATRDFHDNVSRSSFTKIALFGPL
jgi:hypothetical protein